MIEYGQKAVLSFAIGIITDVPVMASLSDNVGAELSDWFSSLRADAWKLLEQRTVRCLKDRPTVPTDGHM